VFDPKAADTASLARDHVIEESDSGLQTIAGGKWTTYRKMAQDSVDQAIKHFNLSAPKPDCQTENLSIIGGSGYSEQGYLDLMKKYAFAEDVAHHLNHTYGDQAVKVAELAAAGYGERLLENHPILEAEIVYAVRNEMAERVIDVLARRISIALLDTQAARIAVPRVREIMCNELGWSKERCKEETDLTEQRLSEAI
jgi:glycerol-3-phosphate dehydrogenase